MRIFTSSGFCICTNVQTHEAYTEMLKTCRSTEREILQYEVLTLFEHSDAAVRWSAVKTIEQMGQQIKSIRFLKQSKGQTCVGVFG